jgi:L-fucose isomerase-like protein
MRGPGAPVTVGTHWILPGIPPGSCHWEMKPGDLTVFRFDGDRGEYGAIAGQGHTTTGPKTLNTYVWMEVNSWPAWERAFISGPYIHHVACCYGHHAEVLQEASRYIRGLSFERLP